MLCAISDGNSSSALPSRQGVRSPLTVAGSSFRSSICTPGLFALTFLTSEKNESSSLFQSAVVH